MADMYDELEERYGIPKGTLKAIRQTESGGNINAVSPAGAKSDFGFMPETAKAYKVDLSNPQSTALGAAQMFSDLLKQYNGNYDAALAHYNGGTKAGNEVAAGRPAPQKETQDYLPKVKSKLPEIDPSKVQWGEESKPEIDVSKVQWNESPSAEIAQPSLTKPEPAVEAPKPEMSDTQMALEGAKKSFVDIGYGAKQLLDIPAQFLEKQFANSAVAKFGQNMGMPTAKESADQTNKAVEQERKDSEELMKHAPAIGGYILGNIGQTLTGGLLLKAGGLLGAGEALINPATYKAAMTAGAAQGLLQPVTQDDSRAFNTGAGAVLGGAGKAIVGGLSRIAEPIQNELLSIGKKSAEVLRAAGVPVDVAQATGSTFLQRIKSGLMDAPITSGKELELATKQKLAFTRAVSRTMGEDSERITPDVIMKAQDRIGQVYDRAAANIDIKANNLFLDNLANIHHEANTVLNDQQFQIVNKTINNILDKAEIGGDKITGDQFLTIKRSLDRLGKSSDTDVASFARDIRDTLNKGLTDSAESAGRQDIVQSLKVANKHWGNMRKIEDVALKNPDGEISPSLLYNSLTTKAKRNAFYADDKSLAELATAGKSILPDKLPNSGTAARMATQVLLRGGLGGSAGLYFGDEKSGAMGAAAGALSPLVIQAALRSKLGSAYLENGLGSGKIGTALKDLLALPKNVGAQKIPLSIMSEYLQSLQPAKTPEGYKK
jgi:hypothetical protein